MYYVKTREWTCKFYISSPKDELCMNDDFFMFVPGVCTLFIVTNLNYSLK